MVRRALSKAQLSTAAGVELLAICQGATADGTLDDADVEALRAWLEQNSDTDLPAAEFLRDAVAAVIADGRITANERSELHKAVESVLPPGLRVAAVAARRDAQAEAKAVQAAEQRRRADEWEVKEWTFIVAGVRHEGRGELVERYLNAGDAVALVREPHNPFSSRGTATAIEIRSTGDKIGYVPAQYSIDIAPTIDAGHRVDARCVSILEGSGGPVPTVVVRATRSGSSDTIPGLLPDEPASAKSSSGAWFGVILFGALFFACAKWCW